MPPFTAKDFPGLFQAVTKGAYQEIPSPYSQALRDFLR